MREHAEREIKIGMIRSPSRVVDEIEKTAQTMAGQNWALVRTVTNELLGSILLFFEREIPDPDTEGEEV